LIGLDAYQGWRARPLSRHFWSWVRRRSGKALPTLSHFGGPRKAAWRRSSRRRAPRSS